MKVESKVSATPTRSNLFKKLKLSRVSASSLILLTILAVSISIATTFYLAPDKLRSPLASWAHRNGYFSAINKGGVLKTLLSAPAKLLRSLGAEEIPKIYIDIKFKHLQKLHKKRNEALRKDILNISSDDYVPASIRHGNQTTNVKLRLKGDLVDHLQGKKWSFRVHVKNGKHLFGVRRFSLQAPWTRGFHSEILFFETLRRVGVLAPRYFFLDVVINGDDIGIMALEEHFSKELLEYNGRREGVIIKFDESLFWRNNQGPVFHNFRNVPIKAFRNSRIEKSEKLSSEHAVAVGLLRGFVEKRLLASEVFDVEKMGRFFGAGELWGASHAMLFTNIRLYLNPISLKLEPVAFDASIPSRDFELPTLSGDVLIAGKQPLGRAILKDPKIYDAYLKTIKNLAHAAVDGDLIEELKTTEQKFLLILNKEFLLLSELPWQGLIQRAESLLKLKRIKFEKISLPLEPTSGEYPLIAHVHLINDAEKPYLEIANAIPQNIEINSIEWVSRSGANSALFKASSKLSLPKQLPPTPMNTLPQSIRIYYSPMDLERYRLKVSAKIKNHDKEYESKVHTYFAPLDHHPIPKSSITRQLEQHPFLTLDSEKKNLQARKGKWKVKGSLIIPPGYSLTLKGETTLQFSRGEGLISNGPLYFMGTKNSPILLEGQSEGMGESWQGIAVLNSKILSTFSFVTIRNTSGISRPGWKLTGGTTFYKSDMEMDSSSIIGHRGEDALNIIQSNFKLRDVNIEDTLSDGLDADFSNGSVDRGLFKNIGQTTGGDGIDISGSRIVINGTIFQGISDKGISVGEKSFATVTDTIIERVATGVASKDGSRLILTNATFKDITNAGLAAYIKKPEYGPALINANNIKFESTAKRTLVQTGSSLKLEGELVGTEDIDVEQYYKTIMKPG
ncbi:MAG: hypothetical protein CMH70_05980 [Nitrosomonadaceae bacterium]|nr:hypothetical protein [Nitrosomonadaceae bacterium]|tara:strand:- start:1357 stop:4068 length:2712 start_codon:yes stop_codon:yes gene_type:complete